MTISVWRMPALLGLTSAFGLVAALVGDATGDIAGWIALAIPIAAVAWFSSPSVQRRRTPTKSDEQEGRP